MTSHGLSHFELAAVLQVIGDARRPEAVGADFGAYAGVERPTLDLDHFKQVNDRHGHIVGDEVLCAAVHNMKDATCGIDLIGRWGGEEFVILLPQANAATAQIVAERIRANIHKPTPLSDPSKHISFTASLGIAIGYPGDSVEDIFRRADNALYRAKSAGRNCIRSAPFEPSNQRKGE